MVKAVQAEESISEYFDGLLVNRVQAEVHIGIRALSTGGGPPVEVLDRTGCRMSMLVQRDLTLQQLVGLIVGKPSVGSRDLALAVVPITSQNGEQVLTITQGSAAAASKAKKAGPKVKSIEPAVRLDIETELVAEHALQASRMLPGGLAVLGLYLFAPESGYSSASSQLCSTLAAMAADSSSSSAASTSSEAVAAAAATTVTAAVTGISAPAAVAAAAGPQELLLLHVDSSSRKFTMRSCQVSSAATAASTLKPCELKFGPSLPSLVCLRCSHSLDFSFPASSSQEQLQQLLQEAVAAETARVTTAVAALKGRVPASSSQPLTELLSASAGGSVAEATPVQLLCLPHVSTALQGPNTAAGKTSSRSSSRLGSCRLHGTIEALAYVHKRDSVGKALQDLKNDVINSLAARLQLLEDDAAAAADEAKQSAAGAAGSSSSGGAVAGGKAAHPLLLTAGAGKCCRVGLARRVLLPWSSVGLQVCDYLADADGPEVALEQAQQQLQLQDLQPSQVVELEAPAAQKQKVLAGTAVAKAAAGAAGSSSTSCSAAVLGAAAAGVAAALAVGVAYMNLG